MGIADGLSRLPTHLMQRHFAEGSEGIWPRPVITLSGQTGINIEVPVNAQRAMVYRCGRAVAGKVAGGGEAGVVLVLVGRLGEEAGSRERLDAQAREIKRGKWQRWLDSGFYGDIVKVNLDGIGARDELDLGRNGWMALENRARR